MSTMEEEAFDDIEVASYSVDADYAGYLLDDELESEAEEPRVVIDENVPEEETAFDWKSVDEDDIPYHRQSKLDGICILGNTWNIVNIDGVQRLQRSPAVYLRRVSEMKGFKDLLSEYIAMYEFQLIIVDGLVLSVLICLRNGVAETNPSVYKQLVDPCHSAIRDAIGELTDDRRSKIEIGYRYDGHISIHKNDWDDVGNKVQNKMVQHLIKVGWIEVVDVYFVAKRFGQDHIYNENTCVFPNIRCESALRVAVSCAYDYYAENYILWWRTKMLRDIMRHSARCCVYRVAILKGLGNVTCDMQWPNARYCQFYTRVFHMAHRDQLRLLFGNNLTTHLVEAYVSMLQRTEKIANRAVKKQYNVLGNGKFCRLLEHCIKAIKPNVPARLEIVYVHHQDQNSVPLSTSAVLERAFSETTADIMAGKFGEAGTMLHAIPIDRFRERNKVFFEVVSASINIVIGFMDGYKEMNHLFDPRMKFVMNREAFNRLYLANAILRFYLFGAFILGYPKWVHQVLQLQEMYLMTPDVPFSTAWPLGVVNVHNGVIQPPPISTAETCYPSMLLFTTENGYIEKLRACFVNIRDIESTGDNVMAEEETTSFFNSLVEYFVWTSNSVNAGNDEHSSNSIMMIKDNWSSAKLDKGAVHLLTTEFFNVICSPTKTKKFHKRYRIPLFAAKQMKDMIGQARCCDALEKCLEKFIKDSRCPIRLFCGEQGFEYRILPINSIEFEAGHVREIWMQAFTNYHHGARQHINTSRCIRKLSEWLSVATIEKKRRPDAESLLKLITKAISGRIVKPKGFDMDLIAELNALHDDIDI